MKTFLRYCITCGIAIHSKEFEKIPIPNDSDGIPSFSISKIIIPCPDGHPNECEVKDI